MKKYIYILIMLLLASVTFGYSADDYLTGLDWKWIGSGNKSFDPIYRHLAEDVAAATGTGLTFYVDSNVINEGDGSTWAKAKNTLNEGLACSHFLDKA